MKSGRTGKHMGKYEVHSSFLITSSCSSCTSAEALWPSLVPRAHTPCTPALASTKVLSFKVNPTRGAAWAYAEPATDYLCHLAIPLSQEVWPSPELDHSEGSHSICITVVAKEMWMHRSERDLGGKKGKTWVWIGEGLKERELIQDSPT